MRSTIVTAAGFLAVLAGCAHAREEVPAASPTPDSTPPPAVTAVAAPEELEGVPVARPRLTRTVTLGEGTDSQYTYAPSTPRPVQVASPNPPTVVNNTIVVQGVPAYGGYPGYRGYGGYGSYGTRVDGRSSGAGGTSQWSTTGWEGARRTAAPGQTPVIGGNWPAPPSYGPAQMK